MSFWTLQFQVRCRPECAAEGRCDFCVCFPGTARVSLENGETVQMSDLRKGDKVQTGEYVCIVLHYIIGDS